MLTPSRLRKRLRFHRKGDHRENQKGDHMKPPRRFLWRGLLTLALVTTLPVAVSSQVRTAHAIACDGEQLAVQT
jgi:hypothetical protein